MAKVTGDFIKKYFAAYDSKDAKTCESMYAPDGVIRPANAGPFNTPESRMAFLTSLGPLTVKHNIRRTFVSAEGDSVGCQAECQFTLPNGKTVVFEFSSIMDLDKAGKIKLNSAYFDAAPLMQAMAEMK